MKTNYILPLLALGVITGCASLEGTNFDSYVQNNGAPTSEYTMQNGNKLYFYRHLCPNRKNWEEYNIEVTPENIVVKKTYTKSCPYQNTVKQKSPTEQRIETLSNEWMSTSNERSKTWNEYINSKTTNGLNHPNTIALKQKYDELNNKEQELNSRINELRKSIN